MRQKEPPSQRAPPEQAPESRRQFVADVDGHTNEQTAEKRPR